MDTNGMDTYAFVAGGVGAVADVTRQRDRMLIVGMAAATNRRRRMFSPPWAGKRR